MTNLEEIAKKYEDFYKSVAYETLKIYDKLNGTRYVAIPGASWLARLKVWFKNKMVSIQSGRK